MCATVATPTRSTPKQATQLKHLTVLRSAPGTCCWLPASPRHWLSHLRLLGGAAACCSCCCGCCCCAPPPSRPREGGPSSLPLSLSLSLCRSESLLSLSLSRPRSERSSLSPSPRPPSRSMSAIALAQCDALPPGSVGRPPCNHSRPMPQPWHHHLRVYLCRVRQSRQGQQLLRRSSAHPERSSAVPNTRTAYRSLHQLATPFGSDWHQASCGRQASALGLVSYP